MAKLFLSFLAVGAHAARVHNNRAECTDTNAEYNCFKVCDIQVKFNLQKINYKIHNKNVKKISSFIRRISPTPNFRKQRLSFAFPIRRTSGNFFVLLDPLVFA